MKNELSEVILKQTFHHLLRHGKVKDALRLNFLHNHAIKSELAESLFQISHFGSACKALDLDGDLLLTLFRAEQPLGAEINIHITSSPDKTQRIMRDGPAVFDQGVADGTVMEVSGGHEAL